MTNPDMIAAALSRAPMAMAAGFLMLSLLVSAQAAASDRPDAAVRGMITEAIQALRRWLGTLRRDAMLTRLLIERITLPHFDLTAMARYVLGSYWQNATPAQCERFRRAFRAYLLQICSHAMEKHAAELDQITRQAHVHCLLLRHDAERGTALVRVVATGPRLGWTHLELRMHDHDGTWKVYEITSSGINVLVGIRSEIQAQLRGAELETVIRRFERRTGLLPPSHSPSARDSRDR